MVGVTESQEPAYRAEHEIDVLTERIAKLESVNGELCAEINRQAGVIAERDGLIRDMWSAIVAYEEETNPYFDGDFTDDELWKRMRELGVFE